MELVIHRYPPFSIMHRTENKTVTVVNSQRKGRMETAAETTYLQGINWETCKADADQ